MNQTCPTTDSAIPNKQPDVPAFLIVLEKIGLNIIFITLLLSFVVPIISIVTNDPELFFYVMGGSFAIGFLFILPTLITEHALRPSQELVTTLINRINQLKDLKHIPEFNGNGNGNGNDQIIIKGIIIDLNPKKRLSAEKYNLLVDFLSTHSDPNNSEPISPSKFTDPDSPSSLAKSSQSPSQSYHGMLPRNQ